MKNVIIILCFCISFTLSDVNIMVDEDDGEYYWKDFTGRIPKDAFIGSYQNGKRTYIGQALYGDLIIPGSIDEEDKILVLEYKKLIKKVVENVKILCTRFPQQLQWIPTSNGEIRQIEGDGLVNGGYEANVNTYIGRGMKDDIYYIGKLLTTDFGFTGLYVGKDGKSVKFEKYEALAYNRTMKNAPAVQFSSGGSDNKGSCKSDGNGKLSITNVNVFV